MLSRIKFEIEPLVEKMLNELPESVWISDSTTFYDPAIGGGQFVRAIEHRLKLYGHDNSNIKDRVFGTEESELHIRFAVNKHKLVGQYYKLSYDNFLNMKNPIKHDVVIGNPPYQLKNQILWRSFVDQSLEVTKDNGHLTLVTPNSWASGAKNNLFTNLFKKKQTLYIDMNGSQYFPSVGKDIGYWLIQNTKITNSKITIFDQYSNPQTVDSSKYPFFIRKFDITSLSIFEKVQKKNSFWTEFVERKPNPSKFAREFGFPKSKYSSYKYGYRFDGVDYNFPTSSVILGIDLSKNQLSEAENLNELFSRSIYKFLWLIYGASDAGSFGWILRNMPKVCLKRKWTDEDLYNHFGFTKDEIEYIENAVK